jgi:hypothetical protein
MYDSVVNTAAAVSTVFVLVHRPLESPRLVSLVCNMCYVIYCRGWENVLIIKMISHGPGWRYGVAESPVSPRPFSSYSYKFFNLGFVIVFPIMQNFFFMCLYTIDLVLLLTILLPHYLRSS